MVAGRVANVMPQRLETRAGAARSGGMDSSAPAPAAAAPVMRGTTAGAAFDAVKVAAEQRAAVTLADAGVGTAGGAATRAVAGRSFRLEGGVWTDAQGADSLPVVRVRAFSDGYFQLLELLPELREPLALGERVRVRGRAVVVEVAPDAPERLDAGARARLRQDW